MIPQYLQDFPGPQQALVDKNGVLTQSGRFLLQALWNRTGGGSGVPNQVATGLAATGLTQADALELTVDWNEVTTVAVGAGVRLAALQVGQQQEVWNLGISNLSVYPPANSRIDAHGTNDAYALVPGKCQVFKCYAIDQIRTLQLG